MSDEKTPVDPSGDRARDPRPSNPRWMTAGLGVLAAGVVIVAVQGRQKNVAAPPRGGSSSAPARGASSDAAVTAESALLAPLSVGARLGDGVIASITPAQRGLMHVYVRSEGRSFDLGVGLAREDLRGLQAGRYAVYILGSLRPDPRAFPLADALARRIRANGDVPPPSGLFVDHDAAR